MKFLLDQCVPASVERVLIEAGHTTIWVKNVLPTNAEDEIVAAVSENAGAVLVSMDKYFKKIAPRVPTGHRARFRQLSRVSLDCIEPHAAARFREAMSLVEAEFQLASQRQDPGMIVLIGESYIRANR